MLRLKQVFVQENVSTSGMQVIECHCFDIETIISTCDLYCFFFCFVIVVFNSAVSKTFFVLKHNNMYKLKSDATSRNVYDMIGLIARNDSCTD